MLAAFFVFGRESDLIRFGKILTLMKNYLVLFTLTAALAPVTANAQTGAAKPAEKATAVTAAAATSPTDLAKSVLAAHGGDKLKKLHSFMVKGAADVSFQGQSLPGAFSTAFSGDKYYFEIVTAVQQLKQVYDGQNTSLSIQGFSLPPVTSLGFPLLPKIGDAGYTIAALPDAKRKGFRMTTPEGFYTDFIVNDKTGQIKSYEAKWMAGNNQTISTSVEIDELMTVDGVTVPKKYSQRFDLGPIVAYVNFKAKDVKVNSPIEDSVFTVGK
jgi:hypothetical protein